MSNPDQSPIYPPLYLDVGVAFALLTRLPLPRLPDRAFAQQARAVWAFGLVGAVVGLIAGGVGWGALWLGLPGAAVAGLVLGAQIVVSGAMHEDGLADSADGLWGGLTRERRLEIMRDSHIGTYGVLALILSLGLRWVALSALLTGGVLLLIGALVAAGAVSRGVIPGLMAALPHARKDGLSHDVGRPGWGMAGLAAVLGIGIAGVVGGVGAALPIGMACLGVAGVGWLARARIGGQTGDILGAAQQVAEIAMLLGFVVALTG